MATSTVLSARGRVEASRESVFAVLRDLDRHRELTDEGLQILSLEGPPGRRTGGWVELRGPGGLKRVARTRVEGAEPGRRLWGSATTPQGAEAELVWTLRPHGEGTEVQVRLTLTARHWRDRLLLRLGARTWLRRRFRFALRRLAVQESRSTRLRTSPARRSVNASTLT